MNKNGDIYIAIHDTSIQSLYSGNPIFTHTSLSQGTTLEMAGIIGINKKGKIILISNNSGHYSPEPLDMVSWHKKVTK